MDLPLAVTKEDLQKELDRCVLGLFQDPAHATRNTKVAPSIFITTIFTSLYFIWDDSIPTACTNGKFLRWNPKWLLSLSPNMRCTVMAHECWHVAFLHCNEKRRGDRDPRRWNAACDYAINWMLKEYGFVFDINPQTGDHLGLLDARFADMSAEQIYDILEAEQIEIDLPFGDDFEEDLDEAEQQEVLGNVIRARNLSQMSNREAGKLPGDFETMIDEILNPKLPWHILLARFFNERSEFGYSWKRPNRRYAAHNLYLPEQDGQEALSHILWACDDSGSMSDDDLTIMNGEMHGVKTRLLPKIMTVVSFDTIIQDTWVFDDENDLTRLKFHGRGGTDPACVFEFAHDMKEKPNLIVVMSDLKCEIPPDPGIEVLWVRFGDSGQKPNYGHIIQVDRAM